MEISRPPSSRSAAGSGSTRWRAGRSSTPTAPPSCATAPTGPRSSPGRTASPGGRYHFDGTDYQVALTEPGKGNAIHGFLRWRSWRATRHEADRVVMATTLFPHTGYPFLLDVAVDYHLTGGGLVVTTTATNGGDRACPYGCGQHPYLSPGDGRLDDCDLEFAAETRVTTDESRQLPAGTEGVAGTAFDFRTRRRIGAQRIDFAFRDLARDAEGLAWARL